MSISVAMKNHLAESATYLCHLWRIEERPREIPIAWDSTKNTNVYARGGYLKKNGGTDGADDAGTQSIQGWTGDIYVRMATRLDGTVYFGLAEADSSVGPSSIEYAIRVEADGTIKIYETGTLKATSATTARAGDWLRVQRDGATITYWHNRTKIYTSLTTSSATLHADACLTTTGATVQSAVFGQPPAVIRATDHTRKITFDSEAYSPLPILPTQWNRSSGLKPDNAELTHILSAGGVSEADILGGRWDYARYEFMTVNYLDLTMGVAQRAKGRFGEFRIDNGRFTAELRSLSQPLSQEIGDIVGALCLARRLGDLRCGQPLNSYQHDATVTVVTNSLQFTVNLSPAKANNYFQHGTVYVRSGNNRLYEREIKGNTGNAITLHRPFPLALAVNDTVTLVAGCARTRAACLAFVNADNPSGTNIENFQGFPDVPGNNKVYRYPD